MVEYLLPIVFLLETTQLMCEDTSSTVSCNSLGMEFIITYSDLGKLTESVRSGFALYSQETFGNIQNHFGCYHC